MHMSFIWIQIQSCQSKHPDPKQTLKWIFLGIFNNNKKIEWNEMLKRQRFASFFKQFPNSCTLPRLYSNSQLFLLRFIAWRLSNLEPELIMHLPSQNFGALSTWMESEQAASAGVSTVNGCTSNRLFFSSKQQRWFPTLPSWIGLSPPSSWSVPRFELPVDGIFPGWLLEALSYLIN